MLRLVEVIGSALVEGREGGPVEVAPTGQLDVVVDVVAGVGES